MINKTTAMSKNEFFRQFTVKLCSSLDIEKAVYQCSLLIEELIAYELIALTIIQDEPYVLKHLFIIKRGGKIQGGELVSVTPEIWEYMNIHLKNNKVMLMYLPENRRYAELISGYAAGILENFDISMPLVFKGRPLGFFAIRSKTEFTKEQIEFISSVKDPITHAVAAAIQLEEEQKQQLQPYSVDIIFNRLKLLGNITTDKKLAQKLGMLPSNIANCKIRNSIPYDKIIQYCQSERLALDYIFMHEPFILNKQFKNGLYKAVLTDGIKSVDALTIEDLLKLPQGSLETYLEKCAINSSIIPPVGKLHPETLLSFQRGLLEQKFNGEAKISTCIQREVPVASGIVHAENDVLMTGRSLYFCKAWTEKLSLSDNIFAYDVQGDSMEPTLLRGDVVLVDPKNKNPQTGGLYAVNIAGSLAIRRLMPSVNESLIMICDNKVYPSDTSSKDCIIGKVVWYARSL